MDNEQIKIERRKGLSLLWLLLPILVALFLNQRLFISEGMKHAEADIRKQELPPALSLTTVALGPLRGLIANALWWRVIEQQDAGNYFEIMQLSDWITSLQPRNGKVWAFQAFNMAYNVSYEFPDGESKWKWVYRAVRLLTDDGLRYNPGNKDIKDEIARLYYDKMCGISFDPGSNYFRKAWALKMAAVLRTGNRKELKALLAAPATEEELMANPSIARLLKTAERINLDLLNPGQFYNQDNWELIRQEMFRRYGPSNEGLLLIIDKYLRRRAFRREFKLDLERMVYIDEQYGPFDWRLAEAYVVYWAATGSFEEYIEGGVNAQPMIRQAMQLSFMNGKLFYDPNDGTFITTNNFAIIGKLHDYYEHLMEENPSPLTLDLHRQFIEKAAAVLYTFNHLKEAREVFHHYQEHHKEAANMDFDTFMAKNLFKALHNQNYQDDKAMVEGALFQAYNWLAAGQHQRALGYANFAKMLWERNQKRYKDVPARRLPPLDQLKASVFKKLLDSPIADSYKQRLLRGTSLDKIKDSGKKIYLGNMMEGHHHGGDKEKKNEKQSDDH